MSISFTDLVKRSTMLKYGLLGILAGIGMIGLGLYQDNAMPARSSLQTIEGQITEAKQVTTKRRRGGTSVQYELTIAGAGDQKATLLIPQKEITEAQVRALLPTKIRAEYDGEAELKSVFVLSSNGNPVMTYEGSVKNRNESNKGLEIMGFLLALAASLVAAVGYWWTKRKLSREIAEWEAQQRQQGMMPQG